MSSADRAAFLAEAYEALVQAREEAARLAAERALDKLNDVGLIDVHALQEARALLRGDAKCVARCDSIVWRAEFQFASHVDPRLKAAKRAIRDVLALLCLADAPMLQGVNHRDQFLRAAEDACHGPLELNLHHALLLTYKDFMAGEYGDSYTKFVRAGWGNTSASSANS